jgi:hypothetical protein
LLTARTDEDPVVRHAADQALKHLYNRRDS